MQILMGSERENALQWLEKAAEVAGASTCLRRKCGSILVNPEGHILTGAENKRPGKEPVHCNPYQLSQAFKSDKACCVHAEQRAIMEALKSGQDIQGSTMVFASVNEDGKRKLSGSPYCTICSKMALEAGVGFWILEHETGVTRYEAGEYNQISFAYQGE